MSSSDKNNSDFTIANILSSGNDLSDTKKSVNFTVSKNDGEIASINVNRKETVENLQAKIQNQCGIPWNKQIFTCFGESTLLNGNDGMEQTFKDVNQIRVNAELIDPSQTCKINDVAIKGEIYYKLLNGKILLVDEFIYLRNGEKWWADNIHISFENSDFRVYPRFYLNVSYHSNLSTSILNRIVCNNLKWLRLSDITITHSDYKKLTTSQKLDDLRLWRVTVIDENGKKVEIDKLLKETKNVEYLHFGCNDGEVNTETAQKLADLPPFPNLCDVTLHNVQESFDLKKFGEFLKKNPTVIKCSLWYKCSDEFYEKIQRVQNDLMPTLPSTCKLVVNKYRDDSRLWELSSEDEE